ncbi:MAG: TetR/AcrR family transcriptional regulator [Nocardioidaceae bacterium]
MLTAATALIAEVGWGRVTTRAVAERAGLPLGAVSYHFRGKQELLSQAALETVEAIFPTRELAAVESLPKLTPLIKTSLGNRDSYDPVLSGALLEAMREAGRNPVLATRITASLAEYRRLLCGLVHTEQQRGAVRADTDPTALATLIAAAGDGLLLHALLDPRLDVSEAAEALLALLHQPAGRG